MSATQDSRAHHYVPKFYLKGFTDNRDLYVYERFKAPRKSSPKREAFEPNYYTHVANGRPNDAAESTLEIIESQAADVVRRLGNPLFRPTSDDMGSLILFVACMFARVPSWREYLSTVTEVLKQRQIKIAGDKEQFAKFFVEFEKRHGWSATVEPEKLRQHMLKNGIKIDRTAHNLGAMFGSASSLVNELQHFGYQILYAPNGKYFMTSDAPVYTLLPTDGKSANMGVGFGTPGVEVLFPLNKRTWLLMQKGLRPGGRTLYPEHVDEINYMTMEMANRFLFSNENFRRIGRIFDIRGCKVKPGVNAFMSSSDNV